MYKKMDQCLGECCGICFQLNCVDMCASCCQSVALAPAAICSSEGCCQGGKKNKKGKYAKVSQNVPNLIDMDREIKIQF
jgi:hypothetical protein